MRRVLVFNLVWPSNRSAHVSCLSRVSRPLFCVHLSDARECSQHKQVQSAEQAQVREVSAHALWHHSTGTNPGPLFCASAKF